MPIPHMMLAMGSSKQCDYPLGCMLQLLRISKNGVKKTTEMPYYMKPLWRRSVSKRELDQRQCHTTQPRSHTNVYKVCGIDSIPRVRRKDSCVQAARNHTQIHSHGDVNLLELFQEEIMQSKRQNYLEDTGRRTFRKPQMSGCKGKDSLKK